MEIEISSQFLRRVKKLTPSEQRNLSEKIEVFRKDPYDSQLKTHALRGRLRGLFAFSLNYSKRVIFTYIGKNKALLLDLGSHEEVYV